MAHEALDAPPPLDMFGAEASALADAFEAATADPAAFLVRNAGVAALARRLAQVLYDQARNAAAAAGAFGGGATEVPGSAQGPAQLLVEGFDAEQIWAQLEAAARPALKRARRLLKRAAPAEALLDHGVEAELEELLDAKAGATSADGSAGESDLGAAEASADAGTGDDDGDSLGGDQGGGLGGGGQSPEGQRHAIETGAFRLADLDRFLEDAEAQGMRDRAGGGASSSEDDEDEALLDAYAGISSGRGSSRQDDEGPPRAENGRSGGDDGDREDLAIEGLLAGVAEPRPGKGREGRANGRAGDAIDAGGGSEDEGATVMYDDFFGPRAGASWPGKASHGSRKRPRSTDIEPNDTPGESAPSGSGLKDVGSDGEEDEKLTGKNSGLRDDDMDADIDADVIAELDNDTDDGGADGGGGSEEGRHGGAAMGAGAGAGGAQLSAHERRMQRMAERVARMEEAIMAEKDWWLRGEAGAGSRPLNSALAVDLDFERAVRPPPQPSEEQTASLEDLIKSRIVEQHWDDPPRLPPLEEPRKKGPALELDDKKSQRGLGEVYADDFVAAAAGASASRPDKDEPARAEARALAAALCAKLDALSHFSFAPKPIVEALEVRSDVPALAAEEIAPQVVSDAAMRVPEEVFRPGAAGVPRIEAELSREQRRARRAARKRAGKKRTAAQVADKAARGAGALPLGRKSAAALDAAAASAKAAAKRARRGVSAGGAGAGVLVGGRRGTLDYSKSAQVFGRMQDEKAGGGSGAGIKGRPGTKSDAAPRAVAAALKL